MKWHVVFLCSGNFTAAAVLKKALEIKVRSNLQSIKCKIYVVVILIYLCIDEEIMLE